MSLPTDPIPAKGFKLVSGKRNPPDDGSKYEVQFSNGYVDRRNHYTAPQLVWLHSGSPWDVIAVRKV
jgi:hypothetical protein